MNNESIVDKYCCLVVQGVSWPDGFSSCQVQGFKQVIKVISFVFYGLNLNCTFILLISIWSISRFQSKKFYLISSDLKYLCNIYSPRLEDNGVGFKPRRYKELLSNDQNFCNFAN